MYLGKAFSILKLIFLKLKYGKKFKFKSLRQSMKADTEIIIKKNAFLSLGRVHFESNIQLLCGDYGQLHIGSRVCFNRNCIVACLHKIVIGDRCLFGPGICVYDHDHAYTADGVLPAEFKRSEIIIEEGCWIGAGAIILRGTHIGKNSVIEAGTVVKEHVKDDEEFDWEES
jgi:acetyltransferase-like isoleucine patch superfamily enzyme